MGRRQSAVGAHGILELKEPRKQTSFLRGSSWGHFHFSLRKTVSSSELVRRLPLQRSSEDHLRACPPPHVGCGSPAGKPFSVRPVGRMDYRSIKYLEKPFVGSPEPRVVMHTRLYAHFVVAVVVFRAV